MRTRPFWGRAWSMGCAVLLVGLLMPSVSVAKTAQEIDNEVNVAIAQFDKQMLGGTAFLQEANGVLVLPKVVQAGVGIGGEYGEGALRVNGKTVGYYSIKAASLGVELGAQETNIILVFEDSQALSKFEAKSTTGWQAGVDGNLTLVKSSGTQPLDRMKPPGEIAGFVFGSTGLLANVSLQGAKITKLNK